MLRIAALFVSVALVCSAQGVAGLSGRITDPQGKPVADAKVSIAEERASRTWQTHTDSDGRYAFHSLPTGAFKLAVSAPGFADVSQTAMLTGGVAFVFNLQFERLASRSESVTVTADVKDLDIQNPDPAQRVLVREEILDANPGRPGPPVSIPGLPAETASSGIKAPQYFAPGVAGDHGEPIARSSRSAVFWCQTI